MTCSCGNSGCAHMVGLRTWLWIWKYMSNNGVFITCRNLTVFFFILLGRWLFPGAKIQAWQDCRSACLWENLRVPPKIQEFLWFHSHHHMAEGNYLLRMLDSTKGATHRPFETLSSLCQCPKCASLSPQECQKHCLAPQWCNGTVSQYFSWNQNSLNWVPHISIKQNFTNGMHGSGSNLLFKDAMTFHMDLPRPFCHFFVSAKSIVSGGKSRERQRSQSLFRF